MSSAVADDELALAPPDRHGPVQHHHARHERLVDVLALDELQGRLEERA